MNRVISGEPPGKRMTLKGPPRVTLTRPFSHSQPTRYLRPNGGLCRLPHDSVGVPCQQQRGALQIAQTCCLHPCLHSLRSAPVGSHRVWVCPVGKCGELVGSISGPDTIAYPVIRDARLLLTLR